MIGLMAWWARPHRCRGCRGLRTRAAAERGELWEGRPLCPPHRVRGAQELVTECLGLCPRPGSHR